MSKAGRRGGPPDLKGTLGTLLRTTINQVGAMTDVARRSAQTQRQRLDGALLERRRREVLADLGEVLFQLVQSGEIELDELPELTRGIEEVEDIDRRIAEAESDGVGHGRTRPVRLARAERTSRGGGAWRPREEVRVWRPPGLDVEPAREPASDPAPSASDEQFGAASASDHGGGIVFLDDPAPADSDMDGLAEYMNEDDVPRGPGTGRKSS